MKPSEIGAEHAGLGTIGTGRYVRSLPGRL
jgi:hypothetical protein